MQGVRFYSLRIRRSARAGRVLVAPSRANDPLLPRPLLGAKVVDPLSFVPAETVPAKVAVPARGDMNVEKFLKTIGRGVEELVPKFASWDELVLSTGEQLKQKGIAVRKRRWILCWIEHYRQGIDPHPIPLMSRAKKNKFLSRRKPKTKEEKKRKD